MTKHATRRSGVPSRPTQQLAPGLIAPFVTTLNEKQILHRPRVHRSLLIPLPSLDRRYYRWEGQYKIWRPGWLKPKGQAESDLRHRHRRRSSVIRCPAILMMTISRPRQGQLIPAPRGSQRHYRRRRPRLRRAQALEAAFGHP